MLGGELLSALFIVLTLAALGGNLIQHRRTHTQQQN